MRIEIKSHGNTYVHDIGDGVGIDELFIEFRSLAISVGYHEDNVIDGCEYLIREYGRGIQSE